MTPTWSENSSYASINASGVLTTTAVTSNQTATITASYTYNGVTKTATKTVTIVNIAATLTGLTINGASSVNESSTSTYTATASWSDASTSTVTPTWSENSSYASINASGVLTTTAVTSNQTATITASYTYNGVTKTATKTVTIANAATASSPVPDTGQTKCYDDVGNVIPCPSPGQAFYGQDANYTINPMSYTKLDADGNDLPDGAGTWTMVRDNVTGLIWENKTDDGTIHDKDNTYTWHDANPATNGGDAGTPGDGITTFDTEQFIAALNAENCGGYHDWRMPTIKELASIVNYSIPYPGPTINTAYFFNTQASHYWSFTTGASDTSNAWGMNFSNGNDYYNDKDSNYYVRAVRGGQAGSLDHLVINSDGTVTDTDTGLMWQQDTYDPMTWESALSTCENSNWAGYTDWRLPTIKELRSLVDYSRSLPAINTLYFPDTVPATYWSSTTNAGNTYSAWFIYFFIGYDESKGKDDSNYVRAVRGGQAGSVVNPAIYLLLLE